MADDMSKGLEQRRQLQPKSPGKLAQGRPETASHSIPQAVILHNSRSITACTSVDTFNIVPALLDRVDGCARHPHKICGLTHLLSHTKKCSNFYSIVSLRGLFEIHNNNKPFSSMPQSDSIE